MGKTNQETITTFAEVFSSSGISSHQNNRTANTNDKRLMIYFQGMKLYIPDGFHPDTLLKLMQVMKKL